MNLDGPIRSYSYMLCGFVIVFHHDAEKKSGNRIVEVVTMECLPHARAWTASAGTQSPYSAESTTTIPPDRIHIRYLAGYCVK